PATRPRHEPGHQGRGLGREAPAPRRARDRGARGARVDRADRGHHDAPAGRQSSPIRGAGAAHRHKQLGTRDHPRGAGGAPAPGARGHPGGRRVTRRRKPPAKTKRKPRPKTASKLALKVQAARRLPVNGLAATASAPGGDADAQDVAPSVAPPVPVRDGTAKQKKVGLAAHPIGRLVARVVLRAGAAVEEAVVESEVFDLSTGTRSSDDVAALFQDLEARRVKPAAASVIPDAGEVPPREPDELLKLLIGNLREKSAERVAARQAVAEKEVAKELDRL